MEIELETDIESINRAANDQRPGEEATKLLVQADNPCSPLLANTTVPCSKKISLTGQDLCRICHCEAEPDSPLVAPCRCSGSLQFVHQSCLQRWVQSSDTRCCELCKYPFVMQTKVKPLKEWEKLDMSRMEQRKLACSVTFHAVAFTCVVWSLYVLIDRSAEEYSMGQLQWPFWTKLVVVAIGFTGGIVFMYVQCTMYVSLCRRWRAYNRVILVQDRPLKPSSSTVEISSVSSPGSTLTPGRWKSDKAAEASKSAPDSVQPVVTITMGNCVSRDNGSHNLPSSGNDLPSEQPEETSSLLDSKSIPICLNAYSRGNLTVI